MMISGIKLGFKCDFMFDLIFKTLDLFKFGLMRYIRYQATD